MSVATRRICCFGHSHAAHCSFSSHHLHHSSLLHRYPSFSFSSLSLHPQRVSVPTSNSMMTALLYRSYSILSRPFHFLNSSPIHLPPLPCSSFSSTPSPSSSPSSSSSSSEMKEEQAEGHSLDPAEIAKFSAMSAGWWDLNGEFCLLHRMNPTRVSFIRRKVEEELLGGRERKEGRGVLSGLKVLDVGCGGGLLSESLARLGGEVLGIDAALPNIHIAKQHASLDPALSSSSSSSSSSLSYRHITAEQLLSSSSPPAQYDIVCSLEVIEHVSHPTLFLHSLSSLVRPGGLLFLSTINRTALAYLLTIVAAEYVLGWVGRGTHEWGKFVKVEELVRWVEGEEGMEVREVSGMLYDPVRGEWSLDEKRTEVNYILCARKREV